MANNIKRVSFDLPADIIFDILSSLPVKTLIRFKSVCKAWYALIENQNFVKVQQKIQSSLNLNPNFSNVLVITKGPGSIEKCRLLHFSEPPQKSIDLELPYLSKTNSCVVIGICNGLVCVRLSRDSPELVICNPTTGKFRKIPSFNIPKEELDSVFLGFGLHDNEYVLIRIVCTPSMNIRAELYAMCTDNWREIEVKLEKCYSRRLPLSYKEFYVEAAVINGVFYWKIDTIIVSADICKGKPLLQFTRYDFIWEIKELNETPDLLYVLRDEHMDSWMKRKINFMVIPNYPGYSGEPISLLGCTRNWEFVLQMWHENNFKMLLYDLSSQKTKFLHNIDVEGFTGCAYMYTESLTPIN